MAGISLYLSEDIFAEMRVRLFYLLVPLMLAAGCSKLEQSGAFYYYFNQKIYLDERRDMIFIQFEKNLPVEQKQAIVQSDASLKPWTYQSRMGWGSTTYDGTLGDSAVLQSSRRISQAKMNALRNREGVLSVSYMFEKDGRFSAIGNDFIVKLYEPADYSVLEKMAADYGCRISDRNILMENTYILERTRGCRYQTLDLTHIFHESRRFYLVDPTFIIFGAFDV